MFRYVAHVAVAGGVPSTLLHTSGGEVVVINGDNFGPAYPRTYISSVTLGPYVPSCEMTIPHSQIQCVTVEGVGTNLQWMVRRECGDSRGGGGTKYVLPSVMLYVCVCACTWQVTVLSQVAVSSTLFNFRAPVLVSTLPSSLPILGTLLSLTGTDLGHDVNAITLTFNNAKIASFSILVMPLHQLPRCYCNLIILLFVCVCVSLRVCVFSRSDASHGAAILHARHPRWRCECEDSGDSGRPGVKRHHCACGTSHHLHRHTL